MSESKSKLYVFPWTAYFRARERRFERAEAAYDEAGKFAEEAALLLDSTPPPPPELVKEYDEKVKLLDLKLEVALHDLKFQYLMDNVINFILGCAAGYVLYGMLFGF